MSRDWSAQIGRCFSLQLSDDLTAWFDQEIWTQSFAGEFNQPASPGQLLDLDEDLLWPGFMLPDTLPCVGNGRGDWLCLRLSTTDTVREAVQWYHGGGDWTPYGASLAEALAIDAARPGDLTRHDHPPEVLHEASTATAQANEWLAHYQLAEPSPAAQVVTLRNEAIEALRHPLKDMCDPRTTEQAPVPWEPDFVRVLFDPRDIPNRVANWLVNNLDMTVDPAVQDWCKAEQAALAAIELREDLCWAWDIAGWAAERQGDLTAALERYQKGLHATSFTDESLSLRTHWYEEGQGKFAAARLIQLDASNDPLLDVFRVNDAASLRQRVRDFWLAAARQAQSAGDSPRAYHGYYQAGWSLGIQQLDSYAEIYAGLTESATAAGWTALAGLARLYGERLS